MNELINKEQIKIEDMIYEIRGKQVMLDSDLAKLYKCKNGTKEINQSVKNNPDKFPERFSWKLTEEESRTLLVKIFDQKRENRGGRYKNPRVFTEQGVAMLATILKNAYSYSNKYTNNRRICINEKIYIYSNTILINLKKIAVSI